MTTTKKMRRKDREMPADESRVLLANGEYGIFSTVGADGQPYGIPMSYVFRDNSIYLHCATDGHKLENIANNPLVSFCVVGRTKVLPDKFATEYESTVAFGAASEVHGEERQDALLWLLEKYSSDYIYQGKQYINLKDKVTKVLRISIHHISGKARKPD